MSDTSSNKGFTLLELLIAMALLVILSTALYGTYFSLIRGRESATAGMESRRELRMTLDMLRRELNSVFYNRSNKRLHFVVEDRDIFGKPASTLDFTAISAPSGSILPASDLITLRYQPVEKEKKIVLGRQVKDLFTTLQPARYPQMEELEGFLVECYDGGKWVKSWDTAINMGLPKSVRVTVRVREGEKTADFFTFATPRVTGN
ncbi:MAG: GspJ family type II secretion system protein [Deltaproteobacteria bacterium]|nr:GspJ family type II secretion system protein [Deltaproteobacteria bacterium]